MHTYTQAGWKKNMVCASVGNATQRIRMMDTDTTSRGCQGTEGVMSLALFYIYRYKFNPKQLSNLTKEMDAEKEKEKENGRERYVAERMGGGGEAEEVWGEGGRRGVEWFTAYF